MKKKISFKMFCSVLGRGLWQAVCWVGSKLGIKDGSTLGKFAKRVLLVSLAAIALMIAIALGADFVEGYLMRYHRSHSEDDSNVSSRIIGEDYTYYIRYWKPSYVKSNVTGEIVLKDIVWLYDPANGDSLAVYKTNDNLRGYFNIYTGEVQIPPKYAKAWIFSGGLASVMHNGRIIFIDSRGKQAFDKDFRYPRKSDGYAFHGQHCAVENDEGNVGLIDKNGQWVLAPEYDLMEPFDNKWWKVTKGDKLGIISDSLTWVLPIEYDNLSFSLDGRSIYASKEGVRMKFDLQGNLLEPFVISNTREIYVDTDETDNEGNPIKEKANCLAYNIDFNHEGLMSKDGKPLTKAIYSNISAISPNRFRAEMEFGEAVILDDKGNILK